MGMQNGEITQVDVLRFLIAKAPGRTAVQLAVAIYAEKSAKQRISTSLDILLARGEVERRGRGVRQAPFRYYPKESRAAENAQSGTAISRTILTQIKGRRSIPEPRANED